MIGLDAVFSVAAVTAAIISSLQAGSRAKYILEHKEIGVKDGPLILPPTGNESSPLWELVQLFQQSVLLGLSYNNLNTEEQGFTIQTSFQERHPDYSVEGYSLSPFPKISNEDEHLDKIVEMYIEEGSQDEEETLAERLVGIISQSWPFSYVSQTIQSTKYWTSRAWHWKKSREEYEEEFMGGSNDELDLSLCISKKMRLDGDHNETQQVAKITAYAPKCFADLRSRFRISEAAFYRSIFGAGPYISFQSNSKGAARSGGVFFFTRDGAYMIKTIKKEEAQTLIKMLPKYYKHMKRNHRYSLLTRFCGMYTVSLRDATSLTGFRNEEQYTFVIMNSVFPSKVSNFISEMYDLKGSTVGREISEEELQKKGRSAVRKDLDLAREVEIMRSVHSKHYGLCIGAAAKSDLMAQLRKDINLLQMCNVMDYSLLVGVVDLEPGQPVDTAIINAFKLSQNEEKSFHRNRNAKGRVLMGLSIPVRAMIAPPLYLARNMHSIINQAMTTILSYPLPYFDSNTCGVDGGAFSIMQGSKSGKRVLLYMGVIDFLQPWTLRKVAERKLKELLGYDTTAISCVHPDEYAARFLEFIDAHMS